MRLIQDYAAKTRVIDEHAKRSFGKRVGDLASITSGVRGFGRDESGPVVSIYVITAGSSGRFFIKVGKRITRYYDANGVLVHEEYTPEGWL